MKIGDDEQTVKKGVYLLTTQGGAIMTAKIEWRTEMDEALSLGSKAGKPILVDFFNPN